MRCVLFGSAAALDKTRVIFPWVLFGVSGWPMGVVLWMKHENVRVHGGARCDCDFRCLCGLYVFVFCGAVYCVVWCVVRQFEAFMANTCLVMSTSALVNLYCYDFGRYGLRVDVVTTTCFLRSSLFLFFDDGCCAPCGSNRALCVACPSVCLLVCSPDYLA